MTNNYYVMMVIVILFLAPLFLASFYVNFYIPFERQRKSIRLEIERGDPEEREYWKKELKKLYISLLPFSGKFIRK